MRLHLNKVFLIFCLLCLSTASAWSQTGIINGIIKDDSGKVIDQVLVANEAVRLGNYSNKKGFYTLEIPAEQQITVVFYQEGYGVVKKQILLHSGETRMVNTVLHKLQSMGNEVVVKANLNRMSDMLPIELTKVNYRPDVVGGVEGIIKSMVGSNNELTSQYSVRGGNFDENLVYVNDFEIYRPFLVRTGQQEGLSFVNSDLVSNVNFSVGGFQSKYGDKMSSVLDVTYKKPKGFSGSAMFSLLGANVHLEGVSNNGKFSYLLGVRQKSNQYVLQAQPTKGVYNPSFSDLQALFNYKFNKNWELECIANYARNRFTFFPSSRVASFGVLNQAYQLDVYYDGGEFDQFDSRFGGISLHYHKDSSHFKLKFLASGFQTNEYETYDIGGEYLFGELQTDMSKSNFGQIKTYLGTGYIQNFARNYLDVNVGNVGLKGSYDLKKHFIQFGATATVTNISDDLHEWERRDSAAFNQPYDPYKLQMAYFYHSSTTFNYSRLSGFIQDNIRLDSAGKLTGTFGIRFNHSFLNNELLISPRMQMAYNPKKGKDVIYKLSAGLYQQPPFYREMRALDGTVNIALKAQKSAQVVAGLDYNYKWYKRDFRATWELYYKSLWDLDPYYYDNVRIRYTGKNNGIGRVYGTELRVYGELVKNATSWISIGILKAEQKITDSPSIAGYDKFFPLPNDQRFMLGMYFEDYLRSNKNYKVHINLMYSTGLPVGPPTGKLYLNTMRLPDYKRADIGFSAQLLDGMKHTLPVHSYFNHIRSIWASLEVFNLLGIQNTLSYTWIQDNSTNKQFAVPNRLTTRLLNVKMLVNF